MSQQDDHPGVLGIAQQQQLQAVEICRSVYEGTLTLREKPVYLPRFEKEEKDFYDIRLGQAVLFNALKKTTKSLTGIVFRDPPTIGEDMNDDIAAHLENVDLAGRHLNVFAWQMFLEKLIDGHVHVLVDWHGPEGARSKKQERESLARPYWTLILKGQVRRARPRLDGGAVVLRSFAYEELDTVEVGAFGEKEILRVRQFDLATRGAEVIGPLDPLPPVKDRRVLFQSWVQMEDGGEWDLEEQGKLLGDRMTQIPVVTDYATRLGYMISEPLFLDMALENLKHWQIRSDRDQNLHVTSIPILNVYGMSAEDLQVVTVGSSMGLAFPKGRAEQGSEYTEAQGTGLSHTREELLDIQQRMAALGLSMLERQSRAAETAEAKRMDQRAQDSELAAQAIATGDALEEVTALHAMWMGLDPEEAGGSIQLNTDFENETMSPALFLAYQKAVGEGHLSLETMWDRLVSGRLLAETFDAELEKERIAASGVTELEAMTQAMAQLKAEQAAEEEDGEEPEEEEDESDEE